MLKLNSEGRPLDLGRSIILRTPGLSGFVDIHQPGTTGNRAATEARPALLEAIDRAEMQEQFTIEIKKPRETDQTSGSRAAGGSGDMVLQVRDPGKKYGQGILYISEDGSASWHYPDETSGKDDTRGGAALTYHLPRRVVPSPPAGAGGQRGIVGVVGKKILKVLVFKLIDEVSKKAGNQIARHFEGTKRPHRLRPFTPTDFNGPTDATLDTDALSRFVGARTLLFVHGTASTAHGGFGQIPPDVFAKLHAKYDGRVFAFNHPTVSVDPYENVAWLSGELAKMGDKTLELDVISHSRGGLVSRLLAEQPALLAGRAEVKRLVMVASPNNGTELANPARIKHLLNRMTSLLQLVPDNGVTDALDIILSVVKQVAVGAFTGLDGIMAMDPNGPFLTEKLNVAGATSAQYFAAASNFEPPGGSPLLTIARDDGTDIVFEHKNNDLVVPTEGVYDFPRSAGLHIADRLVFEDKDGVDHSGYWKRSVFTDQLLTWLA